MVKKCAYIVHTFDLVFTNIDSISSVLMNVIKE